MKLSNHGAIATRRRQPGKAHAARVYQGDFDCINVPLVNVVERMSARNVGATAHYVFVHWVDVQSKTA